MSEYKEKIVNAITGEVTWRDYSEQEVSKIKKNLEDIAEEKTAAEAKATARQAVLDRLGLTAEEAQLLLGGN
jgi:hypothetical protein